MSERDDELLRRYRAAAREAPPASLDASILAASRRSVRAPSVRRWAAPLSIAAVLVLALGLVLKVQREAPEAVMPAQSRAAPSVPAPVAEPAAPLPEASAPEAVPPKAAAPEPMAKTARKAKAEAKHVAPAPPAAAPAQALPAPAAASAARAQPASPAAGPAADAVSAERSSTLDASPRANTAPAPMAAQRAVAVDPLQRELERIARLRTEGKDDEADAALATFRREHPDYRIEPAMWDRVRRR